MSHVLYVDNTGYVQLEGYKNGLTNEYINDAIVTLKLKDKEGNPIPNLLPTISLQYEVGSNGNYSASISEDATVNPNQFVQGTIVAISSGIQSTFTVDIIYKERRA